MQIKGYGWNRIEIWDKDFHELSPDCLQRRFRYDKPEFPKVWSLRIAYET